MELEPRKKEIGEILKAERARRGLSLEEVQSAIKIRKKFLKAMEDNDFSSMPTRVAANGFLKIYATYLGLPLAPIMKEFAEKFAGPLVPKPKVVQKMDDRNEIAFLMSNPRVIWAAAGAVLILLLFILFIVIIR